MPLRAPEPGARLLSTDGGQGPVGRAAGPGEAGCSAAIPVLRSAGWKRRGLAQRALE